MFSRKTLCFPLKRAFFVYFWVSPFSLNLFGPPPFSVSLSLSLSCSCLSCHYFLLSFCFLFLSLFLFLYSLLLFHEKNNMKILNYNFVFFINRFSFCGFLSCFSFQIPFPYLCFFPHFKLCFLFNMNVFGLKTKNLKNTNFWWKGGCNKTGLFINLCFAKCQKLSFFCPLLGQISGDVQKRY